MVGAVPTARVQQVIPGHRGVPGGSAGARIIGGHRHPKFHVLRSVYRGVRGLAIAAAVGCRPAPPSPDPVDLELARLDSRGRVAITLGAMADATLAARTSGLDSLVAAGAMAAVMVKEGDAVDIALKIADLRRASPTPLLVIVPLDAPLAGTTDLPPARTVSMLASLPTSIEVGTRAAREAWAIGADIGLVALPPLRPDGPLPTIERDAGDVARGMAAYLEGVRQGGLRVALRAFPSTDSLPAVLRWDRTRLARFELRELGTLLEGTPVALDPGAVALPSLTGDSLPLSFAPAAIEGLMRRDLAFAGVILADLSPGSPLATRYGETVAAIAALRAGADLLLGVTDPVAVIHALLDALADGRLTEGRVSDAARRVLRLRREVAVPDSLRVGMDSLGYWLRTPETIALSERPLVTAARAAARASSVRAIDSIVHVALAATADSTRPDGREGAAGPPPTEEVERMPWRESMLASLRWPPAPEQSRLQGEATGMRGTLGGQIDILMRRALADSTFTAAAVVVGRRDGIVLERGYGREGRDGAGRAVDPRTTMFDLASLTKVIGTTTAVALLVDDGRMTLDTPLRRYLPGFEGEGKGAVRVRDLLTHTSGLPPGLWVFGSARSPEEALRQIREQALLRPPGERMVYSDLGMILLAGAIERVAEMPLDAFLAERLFAPLGMASTMYLPPLAVRDRIIPTAEPAERDFILQGVVHDANAFRIGGVTGHAGLFSTASDLAVFAQMMLNGGSYGTVRVLSPATVTEFTSRQPDAEQRALGWDTPSPASSAGAYFSAHSFGHTGYTGTSLWIDPEPGVFVVLLTNRTYAQATGGEVLRLRADVHDAVSRAIQGRALSRRPGAR